MDVLRAAAGSLAITFCEGYDPAELERRLSEGQLQRQSRAVSLASLDGSRPVTPASRPVTPASRPASRPVTPESGRRSAAEDVSGSGDTEGEAGEGEGGGHIGRQAL